MSDKCPVFIVVGAADMRPLLVRKLSAIGYRTTPFVNGSDFMESLHFLPSGVAIVDLDLPDMNAGAVLDEILFKRRDIALITTAGTASLRTVVRIIKKGADDFLEQPFSDELLLSTIGQAAASLPARSTRQQQRLRAENCLQTLTAKELDILQAARMHHDNRVIADRFQLSLRTVEAYRARIMRKCGVRRFSDAVAMYRLAQNEERERRE